MRSYQPAGGNDVTIKRRIVNAALGMLAVAAAAGGPARLDAQVLYGSLVGTVTDTSGASVPGATVTATSKETNLARTTVTGDTGTYSFTNVLPGSYDVKVSLQGFKESVRTDVPVSVNEVARVDVQLAVGALTETVTVASDSQLLQTDKADTHTEIRSAAIAQLPLQQNRNYQTLINLVPGATPGRVQNSEVDTPGRALSTNVNGVNRNNNGTKTDGATNVNIWLPHHTMLVSPAETIDTVNVSTSNFDAEQGMAGGAAITVITKSGTNEFKGSGFEFYNNESLNAKPYFATEKVPSHAHIAGATLGGPILKNKLFFFGSWEGQYQKTQQQFFFNVPPDALRSGDFSQAFNPDGSRQIIYDPTTGNADGTGRIPFLGNVIPDGRIDDIAREIQALYPTANLPGSSGANVGGAATSRNWVQNTQRKFDRNNYDFKANYNPSSQAQIWGKYSRMGATVDSPRDCCVGFNNVLTGDTTVNQYTFGTTWTLNPTTVIDATYGISKMTHESTAGDFGLGNFGLNELGIPGTNGGANFSADPRYAGMPSFYTGFSTVGNDDGWAPVQRDERTYALAANMTKLHNNHEFRFGYSLNRLRMNHWQPELGYGPRGNFEFAKNATALNGGAQTANLYNQYAAFLLGLASRGAESVQNELMTTREWQHGLYARDRWQVSSKLTLDLGLRYEYYPLMTRADRGIEQVDLNTLTVRLGGLGGNPEDLGIKVSKTLFAPRLGAIYRLDDNTVLRTGYGITYNPLPFSRPLRGFYPLTISQNLTTTNPFSYERTLEQGVPDIAGPDLSSGNIPLPNTYDMRTPTNDVSRGRIQSWNVAVERRIQHDLSVDVAYVGTHGSGGFADLNINASTTPGCGADCQPFFTTFKRSLALNEWGPRTRTNYHALQVALNRPFRNGLLLKGAYTLSRAKNETDDDGWASLQWNAPSELDRNYALAGYDRTHVFQMAFVYELPYKTSNGKDVAHLILGDWQVNGLFSAFSGAPFTITANGAVLNMPGNLQTADINGEYKVLNGHGDAGTYFDTSVFSQPRGVTFGNTGRNQFRGPGAWNVDFSLFRAFPIGAGTKRAEFRAEFFNLLNHPSWGNPCGSPGCTGADNADTTDVNGSQFGQTFTVGTGSRDAGTGERQIRLGVRFQF
jgi:outer membrane receptor protein involved in Fe transport